MINNVQTYSNMNSERVMQVANTKDTSSSQAVQEGVQTYSNKTQLPATSSMGQDLITEGITIKDLDAVFKKLEGKEGKEFADCAYSELTKVLGIENVAPKSIIWEKNEGRAIIGDYRFYDNSVVFYTDYFLKADKATQLGVIAHELTHCKQLVNMLTTEGLTVEKIAYAYAVSDMRAMLIRNPKIIQMHANAKKQGKEKEFIQELVKAGTIKTTKELYAAHKETLTLPKHPLNSPAGQKAQKDWVAQYNYNGADMASYNACPMEKEAMKVENMVKLAYQSCKIK